MTLKIEQIINNRKKAISSFLKIKKLLTKFLLFLLFNILVIAIILGVYTYFFITYKLYDLSLFYDFVYPIILSVFIPITLFFDYLYSLKIRSDITYEEVSSFILAYEEDELIKLFNLWWDFKLIFKTKNIIKTLRNKNIKSQDLEKFLLDLDNQTEENKRNKIKNLND